MDLLLARDEVARALGAEPAQQHTDVKKIEALDRSLKRLSTRVERLVGSPRLLGWRDSVQPSAGAWWWFPEQQRAYKRPLKLAVWLFLWRVPRWFAWALLTASVGIMAEVSRRAIAGNPDAFTVAVTILQGILALVVAGKIFTTPERKDTDLSSLSGRYAFASKIVIGFLVTALLFGVTRWLLDPGLTIASDCYYESGVRAFDVLSAFGDIGRTGADTKRAKELEDLHSGCGRVGRAFLLRTGEQPSDDPSSAIEDLQRAISLDGRNARAHYRLALSYEYIFELDKALGEYHAALLGRNAEWFAVVNMTELLLDNNRPIEALKVLPPPDDPVASDAVTRYTLARDRGWAYVLLKDYNLAEYWLGQAVDVWAPQARRGPGNAGIGRGAHCLRAQSRWARSDLPRTSDPAGTRQLALQDWAMCQHYNTVRGGSDNEGFRLRWLDEANQRLREVSP